MFEHIVKANFFVVQLNDAPFREVLKGHKMEVRVPKDKIPLINIFNAFDFVRFLNKDHYIDATISTISLTKYYDIRIKKVIDTDVARRNIKK